MRKKYKGPLFCNVKKLFLFSHHFLLGWFIKYVARRKGGKSCRFCRHPRFFSLSIVIFLRERILFATYTLKLCSCLVERLWYNIRCEKNYIFLITRKRALCVSFPALDLSCMNDVSAEFEAKRNGFSSFFLSLSVSHCFVTFYLFLPLIFSFLRQPWMMDCHPFKTSWGIPKHVPWESKVLPRKCLEFFSLCFSQV